MGIYVFVCACGSQYPVILPSEYNRALTTLTFENFPQGEEGAVASALEAVHDCVALVPFLEMVP
jgi:hypothetical protein